MLAKRLSTLREKSDLTQTELAKRLGMARTTYSGYENGTREPDNETLKKIADFYSVSVDYLLGRTNNKNDVLKNNGDKEERSKRPGEQLREYIEQGLTNEQIKQRADLYVAFLALNDEQTETFLNFAREQIFKNLKQQSAAALKSEEQ